LHPLVRQVLVSLLLILEGPEVQGLSALEAVVAVLASFLLSPFLVACLRLLARMQPMLALSLQILLRTSLF
jgi:hypothetical protein